MSIADKLLEIANNVPLVYAAGEKKHTSKYATALVTGDGTNSISFDVPFEPDAVFVTYHGADVFAVANSALAAVFDFRSFAEQAGVLRVRRNSSNMQANVSAATGKTVFNVADGGCTVTLPSAYGTPFLNGTQYVCTAVKYTDKSDRELLEEEIALLANETRTIEYSKSRIYATVTAAEWQLMIAHLDNITFSLK